MPLADSSQYQRYLDQSTSTARDRNIAELLKAAFLPPQGNDAATRAAQGLVGFDDDLPPASSDGGGDDAVVGQVEKDGGSVGCDPGRLVVLFRVER